MTEWQKPTFLELCMNAEIGAYQEDDGGEREPVPVLASEPAPPEASEGRGAHVA
jgi:hypothetical protein